MKRPTLIAVGGVLASGKSTTSHAIAEARREVGMPREIASGSPEVGM